MKGVDFIKNSNVRKQKIEHQEIKDHMKCKVILMGNVVEVLHMDKVNHLGCPIKKLNKHQYALIETGEILEYDTSNKTRADGTESLRRTFKNIRNLINTNFTGAKNELFFTITYADNVTDTNKLYKDFDKFIKKLKYEFKDTKIEYINVVEPQARGAWHCHVLIKFVDLKKIYIPNKHIAELWGQGFTSVKSIDTKGVDNLGAYLSAYLADVVVDLNDLSSIEGVKGNYKVEVKEINGEKKSVIKGGRLHMYPLGMNIYRASRGIKKPIEYYDTFENIRKSVLRDCRLTYADTINIIDSSDSVLSESSCINTITHQFYNLKK